VINPGSTSTKAALFAGNLEKHSLETAHSLLELRRYATVADQLEFRLGHVQQFLRKTGVASLDAVAGRGGLLRPLPSGVYRVNETMLDDLRSARYGEHASNLGALLAAQVARQFSCEAYIADPVVVDELEPIARISGMPEIERISIFHALNHKSAARAAAAKLGKNYEECNLIVAHLGGGISVGAHCRGRVIDVNNALGGEGPFSPERSGGLPALQLFSLVLRHTHDSETIKRKIVGNGGISAYCGTNRLEVLLEKMEKGDEHAVLIFNAMAYQIAKEIAMHGATLKGVVDGIVLTGGLAHNERLMEEIKQRVSYLAPVCIFPGEREMQALAENAGAVLRGIVNSKDYPCD
jgi:butyrate kinase